MSETATQTPPPAASTQDERILPGIVYALYLIGLTHGLTIIIGVIMAYVCRDNASEKQRTHYDFLISTFWKSVPLVLVTFVAFTVSLALSVILIGIPGLIVSAFAFGAIWLWFLIRCVVGAVYLAQDQAHPRPNTWLA